MSESGKTEKKEVAGSIDPAREGGDSRLREISGLLLFALVAFLAASLASWSPDDPCLTSSSLEGARNWMGPIGAHLAGLLMDLFGYGSWLGLFLIVLLAAPMVMPLRLGMLSGMSARERASGAVIVFLSVLILLGLIGDATLSPPFSGGEEALPGELEEMPSAIPLGGAVGQWLAEALSLWIGKAGTALFAVVGLLAGLILSTPFSLSSLFYALTGRGAGKSDSGEKSSPASSRRPQREKRGTGGVSHQEGEDVTSEMPRIKGVEELKKSPPALSPVLEEGPPEASVDESSFHAGARKGEYELPPLDLLQDPPEKEIEQDQELFYANAKTLESKLRDFGVKGKVVEISPGPVVTMYEFEPAPGVKINKVASLADDLALALKTRSVRIVAPIPGKAVIGIELANPRRQIVYLKEIVASEVFQASSGRLLIALGQDIVGNPVVTDLARMPHLLIAGATGTGKSVGLNAIICSLIYRMGPDRLRLLMIDPKRIELSLYEGIPHLIHPVVSEPKAATRALRWAVLEMERRYQLLEEAHARNLEGYNKNAEEPLPYLVVIIDELADLMMVSSKEVEAAIARLAQMARAAGIHLLIATQRPSVDVLTGLIKANFPARISFKVSTKVDSRTILDVMGAERLLGMGDMLFLPPGSSNLERIHGAFVTEAEIMEIVSHWREQQEPDYDLSVVEAQEDEAQRGGEPQGGGESVDPMYDRAVEIVTQTGQASISGLQRRLRVGYNRAARMIEQMERDGIVTPTDSMGRRQVIARGYGEE